MTHAEQPPMFPEENDAPIGPSNGKSPEEVAQRISDHARTDFDPNKTPSEAAKDQGHGPQNVRGIEEIPGTDEEREDAKRRHPSAGASDVNLPPVSPHVPLDRRISERDRRAGISRAREAKATLMQKTTTKEAEQRAAEEAKRQADKAAFKRRRDPSQLPPLPPRSKEQ